jgi:tRNA1Val (adenine37-N6)-methyltransferase
MSGIFQFKQFSVNQANCAMKVNTDGVLLGALAGHGNPSTILDIGTGTGVIALMLAQRYPSASVIAVEMDEAAARTAGANFSDSTFSNRLQVYAQSFKNFFADHPSQQFDLIVSNPPFYIQSLPSPGKQKAVAKHADGAFFTDIIIAIAQHLSALGQGWLIAPPATCNLIEQLAIQNGLSTQYAVGIQSYPHSAIHRCVIVLSRAQTPVITKRLSIYDAPGVYSAEYSALLSSFLTIF